MTVPRPQPAPARSKGLSSLLASALAGLALAGLAPLPALPRAEARPATLGQMASPVAAPSITPPAPAQQTSLAPHAMVAAANPLAVQAGLAVLRAGGGAVDAAVAVQAVLGLVEPQSSGLGGGAFLLFYDAKTRRVTAYDGRETAPAGASPAQFLDAQGKPLPFRTAVLGGQSTGVPGAVAMLEAAHKAHGHRPWASLFAPARRLATLGFAVPARLGSFLAKGSDDTPQLASADARAYFTAPDGHTPRTGERLTNPAYARALDLIARQGAKGLLTGPIAQAIVAKVHEGPLPSTMTLADLAGYKPRITPALCRPYRLVILCAPPAPSGGPALLETLGVVGRTDIARRGPGDEKAWFLFAQALRLAYADRDRWIGDPAFVKVPTEGLLSPAYLASRAALIGESAGPVSFGTPPGAPLAGADSTRESEGTSHFVIADTQGNVVSMTTTVEAPFGSGRMVSGFFLNNQLTDFAFAPVGADGLPAANAVAPGKRPRSSMAPVIVLERDGRFLAALGSPGGGAITAFNAQAVVALIDWRLSPQQVASLPHLVARGDKTVAEPLPPAITAGLAGRGLPPGPWSGEESGLHLLIRNPKGYEGAADPRRDGVARGF